jgi:hypothetical protein
VRRGIALPPGPPLAPPRLDRPVDPHKLAPAGRQLRRPQAQLPGGAGAPQRQAPAQEGSYGAGPCDRAAGPPQPRTTTQPLRHARRTAIAPRTPPARRGCLRASARPLQGLVCSSDDDGSDGEAAAAQAAGQAADRAPSAARSGGSNAKRPRSAPAAAGSPRSVRGAAPAAAAAGKPGPALGRAAPAAA